jgi:hypothetical protein
MFMTLLRMKVVMELKKLTLDTEILVIPMPELTATERSSELDPVLPETCQCNKKLFCKNQHLMLN